MKEKKSRKRMVELLLAAMMLVTAWGGSVRTAAAEVKTDAVDATGVENRRNPKNPVYDAETDTTEWSYVWFGSYPQTEVTGDMLTSAIRGASYDSNGDATVNGVKYRRLDRNNVTNTTYFGNSAYRYFKWEPIKWRVLQNDGETLFLLADQGLDCQQYHLSKTGVTWSASSLRGWLNGTFYNAAFNSEEQKVIRQQIVKNDNNPFSNTNGGNDTQDNVYCLSIEEATNVNYGFPSREKKSNTRRMKLNDYSHVMGCMFGSTTKKETGVWNLRSPGLDSEYAALGGFGGDTDVEGFFVNTAFVACVPALHIDLSSDLWKSADGNPVYDAETDMTEWSYVYFGSYPQTEVTGDMLTPEITGASYDSNGDATVNGEKYRRLSKSSVEDADNFGDSAYRYFKWEPIKWRVLQNDGETLFLLADQGLDYQQYHTSYTAVTWSACTLRGWLNDTFYTTAFRSSEQRAVRRQTVVNANHPENGTSGGGDTQDNVYLLSIEEVENPDYGFSGEQEKQSKSRQMKMSDYASVMGAERYASGEYRGNGSWWLRSPVTERTASYVYYTGARQNLGNPVHATAACVPALHIDLSADFWTSKEEMVKAYEEARGKLKEAFAVAHERYGYVDLYTQDSWSEFEQAYAEAEEIMQQDMLYEMTPDELREMTNKLLGAIEKLTLKDPSDASRNPANPVYDAEADTTEWSYVYFGRYPQTEVTGDALTPEITGASYDSNGDATVNGEKYRRLNRSGVTNTGNFGDSAYRYFKWEPIKWRVLQNDGETLFALADQGLDCQKYYTSFKSVTWSASSLRVWLNETFYNRAFNEGEREAIRRQEVVNANNPNGTDGGSNTQDNVYLLSIAEAESSEYGFSESYSAYSNSRRMKASDYAYVMGAARNTEGDYIGNVTWGLRSPGSTMYRAAGIDAYGSVDRSGYFSDADTVACVPALHINLSSDLWHPADNDRNPANPVYNAETDTAEWSRVWFGSYPQTEVTEEAQISELEQISFDSNGDAWVDGVKYRRIRRGDVSHTGNFGDREYRYFKWERIPWRVLRNDGDTLYLLADQGLDCQDYSTNSGNYGEASWKNSALRGWLNDGFYRAAFDGEEQTAILERSDLPEGDKLGLLTEEEARDTDRGFGNADSSDTRIMGASAYSYAMGSEQQSGEFFWWLMPNKLYTYTYATTTGGIRRIDNLLETNRYACVPTLCIRRDSSLWLSEDDGTGGGEEENKPLEVSDPHIEIIKGDEGVEVKFSLVVRGASQKYEYQWYESETMNGTGRRMEDGAYKEDVSVEGANQSVLTMRMPELSEAYCQGYYYCVVTDGAEMVESGRVDLSDNVEEKPDNPVTPEAPSENEIKNPVYNAATDSTTWSAVWFGSYPQSEVTGAALTSAIVGASYNVYGDAWVNGTKYRRILKESAGNSASSGSDAYRYFKWERIRWRVLQNADGTLRLMADAALDGRMFHEREESAAWEDASLRAWLNDTFYSTAFNERERSAIRQSAAQDKVSLLSVEDASLRAYGFTEQKGNTRSRRMAASDYAKEMGVWMGGECCFWWLRTPGESDRHAAVVDQFGLIDLDGDSVTITNNGVVPVLDLDRNADCFYLEDDGTSGSGGGAGGGSGEMILLRQPSDQETTPGNGVTFSVEMNGGSYAYQWYYAVSEMGAGVRIDGATSASYTIPGSSVTKAIDGSYYFCMIEGSGKFITSARARLTVKESGGTQGDENPPSNPDDPWNPGGVQPPLPAPGAPSQTTPAVSIASPGLTVKLRSYNSVQLAWNAVDGAEGYRIYRATSAGGPYGVIQTLAGTQATDQKLKKGKTYYYRVEAYGGGAAGMSSTVAKKMLGKPKKPSMKMYLNANSRFTIAWSKMPNVKKIEIGRSVNGGKYKKWKVVSAKKRKATFSYASFKHGVYRFQIRAYYEADGVKVYGSASNNKGFYRK